MFKNILKASWIRGEKENKNRCKQCEKVEILASVFLIIKKGEKQNQKWVLLLKQKTNWNPIITAQLFQVPLLQLDTSSANIFQLEQLKGDETYKYFIVGRRANQTKPGSDILLSSEAMRRWRINKNVFWYASSSWVARWPLGEWWVQVQR